MSRIRIIVLVMVALVATGMAAIVRRNHLTGRAVPGGVLIGDTGNYDRATRLLMGGLFRGIAADVAAAAPPSGKVLEVGCGPGLLAIQMARKHQLEVTALDLDPAMIERARANAVAGAADDTPQPTFIVGDVAALPFADGSFDLVVSTFSVHHWSDPSLGMGEIARVLRPGGRALIWDLRPGILPFHPEIHDVGQEISSSPLGAATVTPWRWPGRFSLANRSEFVRDSVPAS